MQATYTTLLALVAGFALGAAAIETLHAQAKPAAFVVAEVNVKDMDGYKNEFQPAILPIIEAEGGKFLARGGKTTSFAGALPSNRVVITQYESLDRAQEWWSKANGALSIGRKYAEFSVYAVEGISQ